MNDVTNKMILDGYKSLSDKVDDFDYKLKMIYEHLKDQRSAIIELDRKVDVYLDDIEEFLGNDDEDDLFVKIGDADMKTLLIVVRQVLKDERITLHDIIREIINNA